MIMKKNWKNRSAVSPVIATILMVAITVVLAAVLYVMVMGFGSSPTQDVKGALGNPTNQTTSEGAIWTIPVVSVDKSDVALSSCKVNLMLNGTSGTATTLPTGGSVIVKEGSTTTTFTVSYNNLDGSGKVKGGDVITVKYAKDSIPTGTVVTVTLLGPNNEIAHTTFTA